MDMPTILIILGLFVMIILAFYAGKALGKRIMFEIMQDIQDRKVKEAVNKSRAVLKGQFSEHLSPFDKDFPVKPSEARFLGAPIDFIAFVGLDEREVEEVVFIEVKTGSSRLNPTEKSIKEAIKKKKVRFEEYRLD